MGFDYGAKIRGLLAKADGEEALGNEGVAAQFRAKALEWMDRYRIAEEDALAEDPTTAEPILVTIDLTPPTSDLVGYLPLVADTLARHCDVRLFHTRPNWGTFRFNVVGYEGDLRYFELLWTSAYLMFSTRIDPHWDDAISEAENIYRMRRAGHTRREIADRAWGNYAGEDAKNRSKVQRIYVAQAKAAGEDPTAAGLGFQVKDYRQAYGNEFLSHLTYRLRRARDAANAVGGVVVLAGRAERVQEAFYTLVPDARPSQQPSRDFADPTKVCDRCQALRKAELNKALELRRDSSAITCNEHKAYRTRAWSAADEARWNRKHNGQSARAGRASGREAADGVALRGTSSPTANRLDASNRSLEG